MSLRQIVRTVAGSVFGLDREGNPVWNRRDGSQIVLDSDASTGIPSVTTRTRTGTEATYPIGSGGVSGPYADLAALIAASPAATNAGKTAMVGAAAPYAIYSCDGSNWTTGAGTIPVTKLAPNKVASVVARAAARTTQRGQFRPVLDALGASALCAYGVTKLRAAYAGNCMKVRRVSDSATLDIPFESDGGVSMSLLRAFAGASTLTVDTWYDQVGANNLTQATVGNQPAVDLYLGVRCGLPSIVGGNGIYVANASVALTSVQNAAVWGVIGSWSSKLSNSPWGLGASGNTFNVGLSPVSAFSVQPVAGGGAGSFGTMLATPAANGCVIGHNSAASGQTFYRSSSTYTTTAGTAVGATGLFVPHPGVTTSSPELFATVVFNAALSTADATLLQYGLSDVYQAVVNPSAQVVLDGDSIVVSAVAYGDNYCKALSRYLPADIMLINKGLGGQTAQSEAGEQSLYLTPLFKSGIPNIAVMMGGVNDIDGGRTAAQLTADWTTWATAVKAAGFKAIIATLYPRQVTGGYTTAKNNIRIECNNWARANSGAGKVFDGICDFETEAYFLPAWLAVDSPDNLHPNRQGYLRAVPVLADAIMAQLPGI